MISNNNFELFLEYKEIFGNDANDVINYIQQKGVAEKFILFTSRIASVLYSQNLGNNSVQKQIVATFRDVLKNTETGLKILQMMCLRNMRDLGFCLYSAQEVYCILMNNMNGECDESIELSQKDKEYYLKLWLYANQLRLSNQEGIKNTVTHVQGNDPIMFEKYFWCLLLPQSDINEKINVLFETLRFKTFIDVISKEADVKGIIEDYFFDCGCQSSAVYSATIIMPIFNYYLTIKKGEPNNAIMGNSQIKKVYTPFLINGRKPCSYKELKQHPVYLKNGCYYILHWNYFLQQIYLGFYMHLKNNLVNNKAIADNLKARIGIIMEQNLLTNLLKDAFRNKWQRFISSASDNYPDAMFQIGNKLFIIECKDCLMDETTCESSDFETIKANIDRNFIRDEKNGKKKSKAKGISQLANYIEEYIKGNYCNYESVDLDKRFIFNSKLVIYPIIIFTDFHYKLSGLNHYLNLEFQKILLNKESICPQRIRNHIRPVTTISLDFLFMYKYKFQSGECRLSDMIDKYHKKSAYLYRTKKNKGVGALSQQYRSFDWENNRDLVPHGEGYNKDIAYICGRE